MNYAVCIFFDGRWFTLSTYLSRGDAEWAIALWRLKNGSNGKDTGFKVEEM